MVVVVVVVVVGVGNLSLPNVGLCLLTVSLQSKMTEILQRGSYDPSFYRASPTTRTTKLVSFEGGFAPSNVGSCWKCSAAVQSTPADHPDMGDGDDDDGGGDGGGRVVVKSMVYRDRISNRSVCSSTCLSATKASGEIPIHRC